MAEIILEPRLPIISLRGVNKWYGSLQVLHDVTLDIERGEKVIICGPSGSGKSTAVNLINGLQNYQSGDVLVAGVRVSEREGTAHDLRRHIGMVFQQFNLFPHMTVLENCCIGQRLVHGVSREAAAARAMEELRRVQIADKADRYPETLSGGQKQRVAIVRALCMQPKILLFDEPTSALDPEMVGEVLDVMLELSGRGMTIVCVTHEMGFARRFADRIVMMENGRVIEALPPERFMDPQHNSPRVRAFLDQIMKS